MRKHSECYNRLKRHHLSHSLHNQYIPQCNTGKYERCQRPIRPPERSPRIGDRMQILGTKPRVMPEHERHHSKGYIFYNATFSRLTNSSIAMMPTKVKI